jgi:hypothetical protein
LDRNRKVLTKQTRIQAIIKKRIPRLIFLFCNTFFEQILELQVYEKINFVLEMNMSDKILNLQNQINSLKNELINHPLYSKIKTLSDFNVFTEQHVFAVWDFMSLLKTLQRNLTCISVPWRPVGSPEVRRFINEIVLGEESDIDQHGQVVSHFELYCQAMNQLGADLSQMELFTNYLSSGDSLEVALERINIYPETKDFVKFTFQTIESNEIHKIASVFTFGREDLIPDMFISILREMNDSGINQVSKLLYYLERHIEVDGDDHGPISLKMIQEICGDDDQKWNEASEVAMKALEMRIHLWNGILARL